MMRKYYISALLFLVMVLGLAGPMVVEASSVSYVNQAERFVFVPEDTDLFDNFKGVMPGDLRIQKILVGNDSKVPVKIYMKMISVHEDSVAFLEQLNLIIEAQDEILFEEKLNQQGLFKEFRLIKRLEPDTQMALNLTLEVPLSLSNEFMDQEAEVEWIFKVEEDPKTENPKLPDTGSLGGNIWYVQGILSIAVGCFLFKKRKHE